MVNIDVAAADRNGGGGARAGMAVPDTVKDPPNRYYVSAVLLDESVSADRPSRPVDSKGVSVERNVPCEIIRAGCDPSIVRGAMGREPN